MNREEYSDYDVRGLAAGLAILLTLYVGIPTTAVKFAECTLEAKRTNVNYISQVNYYPITYPSENSNR